MNVGGIETLAGNLNRSRNSNLWWFIKTTFLPNHWRPWKRDQNCNNAHVWSSQIVELRSFHVNNSSRMSLCFLGHILLDIVPECHLLTLLFYSRLWTTIQLIFRKSDPNFPSKNLLGKPNLKVEKPILNCKQNLNGEQLKKNFRWLWRNWQKT